MKSKPGLSAKRHLTYEHKAESLLPRRAFLARLAVHAGIGIVLVSLSLGIGMIVTRDSMIGVARARDPREIDAPA